MNIPTTTEILRVADVYALYVSGVWIGDAPSYADADAMLNQWLFDRAMLAVECGLTLAEDDAAHLARTTHGCAYVVCGDADVAGCDVVWSVEPESVYFADEIVCEEV